MTSITTHDCALNAAEALTKADGPVDSEARNGLVMVADMWVRLLDAMVRAGIGRAERTEGPA